LEDITLEYIPTYITYNIKDNPNDILHWTNWYRWKKSMD
jgi:hypothetical protein